MGTILASAILGKAQIVLQDTTNVRWPQAELLGWLNDGQREICAVLPQLTATTGNITLVAGTKQSLPTGGIALLRIVRNMGTSGSTVGLAMRKVPSEILDSQVPDWHTQTAVTALKHYTYDTRTPRVFYVYPPSVVSNQVEAVYSVSPADVAAVGNVITLDDIYATMILDYVLYRAYTKDLEQVGNGDRAGAHYAAFQKMLSAKATVDASLAPADMVKG